MNIKEIINIEETISTKLFKNITYPWEVLYNLENKIIGVQDSTSASIAADMLLEQGIKVKEIKKYDRNANAVADLNNGRIDAIVVGEDNLFSKPYSLPNSPPQSPMQV